MSVACWSMSCCASFSSASRTSVFGISSSADRPHLGSVEELLHHQRVLDRAEHHDVLLAARRPASERAAPGFLQRFREQRVRLRAALVGREVVGLVEVHRVDARDRDELGDLDHVGARLLQRLQLFRREDDVLVLGELVALHRVLARHHDAFLGADVLLLQARAARRLVQHVEGDRAGGLGRRIELHRDRHESEGHRQRCDGTGSHTFTHLPVVLCAPGFVPSGRPYAGDRSRAPSRLCLSRRAFCQRSPVFSKRSGAFVSRKSRGCALASSSQASGMDTGAPGSPRGE